MRVPASAKYVFIIVALSATSAWGAAFAFNEAHRHVVLTTDSIIYVDTARHIAAEKQISTGIVSLDDTTAPIPQTQWPPLYPMAMAPMIATGLDPIFSGRIVSAIAFALTVFLVGLWLWRLAGPGAGIATATLMVSLSGLTSIAAAVWADALYTLIVVGLSWFGFETAKSRNKLRWFGLGTIIGLGITTKYLGLLLYGLLLFFAAIAFWRHRQWKIGFAQLAAAIAGSLIFVVPLLTRNVLIGRPLGGADRTISTQPLSHIFGDLWSTLTHDFSATVPWSVLIGLAGLGLLLLAQRRKWRQLRIIAGLAAVGGIYWIGLVAARSLIHTDDIYTRFTMPVYPMIVAAIVVAIAAAAELFGKKWRNALLAFMAVTALSWSVKTFDFGAGAWAPTISQRTQAIEAQTKPTDLIIGNGSREYALFLGRKVVHLPASRPEFFLTPERITMLKEQSAKRADQAWLALTPGLDPKEYGDYAAALSNQAFEPWQPRYVSPAILLYDLSGR